MKITSTWKLFFLFLMTKVIRCKFDAVSELSIPFCLPFGYISSKVILIISAAVSVGKIKHDCGDIEQFQKNACFNLFNA